ncbi:serine hydrolase domain-containing protein [Flavilitoribacter nigricans]|uniref:Beta-lactamase-related domain-containing protein n=1 Tax=Flavilitoribacter nigricans (strain ATCC 23147 / DSM 23189 / NBRC 102662 / NCIMB 1420 / SS-2) TaxID=1122177 RepID=A0A2D0N3N3_FLAN2|nr:serine hydrolase domain-containing protein [Flavilitoribacter nigricans]PHN03152.1 hypothetical protein CRP01_29170 [Flavilitoribacter nigricans DSM 23189 = NBRC 102662]
MKTVFLRIIRTITFLFLGFSGLLAQADLTGAEAVIEKFSRQDQFSGVVLLAEDGKIVYQQAVGLADRTSGKKLEQGTKFRIASITKSFTALVIMQLYEEEQLSLDQSVNELLPGLLPDTFSSVKVRHLLNHTSGLPGETDEFYAEKLSPEVMIRRLTEREQPRQPAGTAFNYNNVDYLLLGLIIEDLSGKPWETVIRERILIPLEMHDTGFLEKDALPADLASGYLCENGDCVQEPDYYIENYFAAGSMYATAADLLKWDQGLYGEKLLSEAGKTLMYTSDPALGYIAFGSWTFHHPFIAGNPFTVERRGGILGFNSVIMRFPLAKKTLIILSNTDQFNPDTFGNSENIKEQLLRILFASGGD